MLADIRRTLLDAVQACCMEVEAPGMDAQSDAIGALSSWELWSRSPSKWEVEYTLARHLGDHLCVGTVAQAFSSGRISKDLAAWGMLSYSLSNTDLGRLSAVSFVYGDESYVWDPASRKWCFLKTKEDTHVR